MRPRIFLWVIFLLGIPHFLSAAVKDLPTPLEKSNFSTLTSHAEMMVYLKSLVETSRQVNLEIIGHSVEGREIPALYFSSEKFVAGRRQVRPVAMIFCQQHGNEPSGKEAALVLAREFLDEKHPILQKLDVILIPQVNPDGAEKNQRRNARSVDLNRNHAILSEPETQALRRLFLQWMPEVTLDVHEYTAVSKTWVSNGFIKNADEQLGKLSNLNVASRLLDFSREVMVPAVEKKVKSAGFTFHEYVVGTPFDRDRMRYSTTAVNDGRQSLGIYQTLSFILEGKQYGDALTQIQRRTAGQVAAMKAFLQTVADNASLVVKIVRESRQEILQPEFLNQSRAALQMDYFIDSSQATINFPVFDLMDWKAKERELKNFHSKVRVKKSVKKPLAYLIPASESALLEILGRHQIEMKPLPVNASLEVQAYHIQHVTSTIEEELEIPYIDLETLTVTREFATGSMIIYLSQPAGVLIPLLLEPQSTFSLFAEGSGQSQHLAGYLKENVEFPIYRMMKPVGFLPADKK